MMDDHGYAAYRQNKAWVRANLPLLLLCFWGLVIVLTAVYGWGHAMGKRDLLVAARIGAAEGREGRDG
jgi:hypothetical protein